MARQKSVISNPRPKLKPALTPEAREQQMIALAMDLVEQRLRDGTASSQETTHFLKAASEKSKLELQKLKLENENIAAKTKSIERDEEIKALYENAIKAMRRYAGHGDEEEYDDY